MLHQALDLVLSATLLASPSLLDQPEAPAPAAAAPAASEPAASGPDRPAAALPEDGRGMLTLGGFVFAAGAAALTATSVGLARADRSSFDRYDRELYGGLYVLSAVAFTGAGLLTGFGVKRQRRYRSWRAEQPGEVPPQGNAMIAAGAMFIGAGGVTTLAGVFSYAGISLAYTPDGTPDFPYYLMGIGPAAVAAGVPLLVLGKRRRKRALEWRQAARLSPYVVPVIRRGEGPGLRLGLVGRF